MKLGFKTPITALDGGVLNLWQSKAFTTIWCTVVDSMWGIRGVYCAPRFCTVGAGVFFRI
jgi:hypothetical protein